ncbi:MAG: UvrD-helicase domain-containing protein [Puniceicoccales bacterium]|jgi:hypothetical protein|nr:UvrD-helicase domain-containing protein [Puniceicoccales bacterium]
MLADRHKRDEFTKNLFQNFSVIASPGTGKTTAITERISNLVRFDLPIKNFIAVTYTERAAKEIKERVYSKILTDKAIPEMALKNLDEIFFGTIHGFCAKFLREHHQKAKLERDFEIVDDDRGLWLKFTSQINTAIDKIVPSELHSHLTNHFKLSEILTQAHEIAIPDAYGAKFEPIPMESIGELLNYKAEADEGKIRAFQGDVKIWLNSNGTCSFPEIPVVHGQKFSKCFHEKYTGICGGNRR